MTDFQQLGQDFSPRTQVMVFLVRPDVSVMKQVAADAKRLLRIDVRARGPSPPVGLTLA